MYADMSDKVALVTGGSSGIGKAAALGFANEGVKVIIASRSPSRGKETAAAIRDSGGEAEWIQTDVSHADQVAALMDTIQHRYGKLDYAFNNAGSGGQGGWLTDIEEQDWDETINTYLKSVFLCMKHEIKAMLSQGGGVIVNNSSVDGLRAFPWDPVYSAAKHGVIGLTKSCAVQYAKQGVRINAICPGWIQTPATEGISSDPKTLKEVLLHQPVGRLGKAEEVAQAVLWLCSDQSSFIVGTSLAVDGGYLVV